MTKMGKEISHVRRKNPKMSRMIGSSSACPRAQSGVATRGPILILSGIVFAMLSIVLQSCGEDGVTSFTREELAGDWKLATVFIRPAANRDSLISVGPSQAEVNLRLNPDGTTSGNAVIPPEGTPTEERLEASLNGEWNLNVTEQTVAFDFDADLFLEEISFRVSVFEGAVFLIGMRTFDETHVEIELSR